MIKSKFTIKKFLKLWGQLWFYTIGLLLFVILFFKSTIPTDGLPWLDLFHLFFPITFNSYWFISTYIWLMLMSPILNNLLLHLSKDQFRLWLLGLLLLSSLVPSLWGGTNQLSSLGTFIFLYSLAAYLRIYKNKPEKPSSHFLLSIILYFFIYIFTIYKQSVLDINDLLVILLSLELFRGFTNLKPHCNKTINIISSATLGVYLIHDNHYLRPVIWGTIFNNQSHYGKGIFLYSIIVITIVYIVCTIIDLLRQYTLERLWIFVIDKYILPFIEQVKSFCIVFIKKCSQSANQIFTNKKVFISKRCKIQLLLTLLFSLFIIIFGVYRPYRDTIQSVSGNTEKLYVLIHYFVNSLYLFIPLFISSYLIICAYSGKSAHPFQRNGALFHLKLSGAQLVD